MATGDLDESAASEIFIGESDGQGLLDLGMATDPRNSRLPVGRVQARDSLHAMVRLALEQGYAADVGDLLDQVARVDRFRLSNGLLAVLQRPHARHLLPAHEWRRQWGRRIRPGQQPIILLVPFGPVMFLFEVSQTEEAEDACTLPASMTNPYAMEYAQGAAPAVGWLTTNAMDYGVRVTAAQRGSSAAGCVYRSATAATQVTSRRARPESGVRVPVRFEVLINESYAATEKLATLAHELGHLFCGHLGTSSDDWWPERRGMTTAVQEYEAEGVARLVFRRLAPGVELPPHLDQYFGSGDPLPTDGWEHIVAAADLVIDMCQGRAPKKVARSSRR